MIGAILGGIGSALGLGGGGGGSSVKAETVNIDPETLKAYDKFSSEANQTPVDKLAEQANQGIGEAKDYSKQTEAREKALGGYEPGIGRAINQRYQNLASEGLSKLKNQGQVRAFEQKAQNIQTAQAMKQARDNVNMENQRRVREADMANQRARSSALSSVLGLVGTVAGAAIGGPVGASVGGTIGSGIGKSL